MKTRAPSDQNRAGARRGRGRARGFTLVEILVAVVVTLVGFAAIFQMQIGSMQGNIAARELASATNLAERYVEILRRDAYQWTQFDLPAPLLNQAPMRWHSFTPTPVDQNGRAYVDDDPAFGSALSRQRFCVHYWFEPSQGVYDGILNARVRVIWPRSTIERSPLYNVCGEDAADAFVPLAADWYTLTVPATVRRHPG